MTTLTAQVRNADRMMTFANVLKDGIEVAFADGRKGLVPFAAIPEVKDAAVLARVELPSPYQVILHTKTGEIVELPWDFARHYCDASYRRKIEALGAIGRESIGKRIRLAREKASLTQDALASVAGIGRVTLVRVESGEQSPRFDTLLSISKALGVSIQDLLTDNLTVESKGSGRKLS